MTSVTVSFGRVVHGARVHLLLAVSALTVGGCATLPSSGPTAHDITVSQRRADAFQIINIDQAALDRLSQPIAGPTELASLAPAGDAELIGPGDVLQVSIYEIGPALFSGRSGALPPAGAAITPPSGSAENLPPVVVGSDGGATIPWVGRILVSGATPDAVAGEIARRLQGRSQDPQVIVSVRENIANTVMVLGDVRRPGRVPLTLARERLLDAIAMAGGTANTTQDNMVQVNRGEQSGSAPLAAVIPGSADDLPLMPRDRISVTFQPRTFTVFGASDRVSEIPFQSPRVTLAEAIARAGGPSDARADPTAVFVFRFEPSLADGRPAPNARAVAYRLDLMEAESYFRSQTFEMRPRDVIYVANARSNIPTKLVQIFNLFFSPFYTARVLTQ